MHTRDRAKKQQEVGQKMKAEVRSEQVMMLYLLGRSNEIKEVNANLGCVPLRGSERSVLHSLSSNDVLLARVKQAGQRCLPGRLQR